jgi:hypothetical protein
MTAEIKDGNLIITLPMGAPAPSKSGKSMIIASTHGNQPTTLNVDGQPVIVSVNAYTKK